MAEDKIQAEIDAFNAMRVELEKHHMGKFVVIKDGQLVGAYDTFDAAAREALSKFGPEPFLIRQVGGPDTVPIPASVAWHPIRAAG